MSNPREILKKREKTEEEMRTERDINFWGIFCSILVFNALVMTKIGGGVAIKGAKDAAMLNMTIWSVLWVVCSCIILVAGSIFLGYIAGLLMFGLKNLIVEKWKFKLWKLLLILSIIGVIIGFIM